MAPLESRRPAYRRLRAVAGQLATAAAGPAEPPAPAFDDAPPGWPSYLPAPTYTTVPRFSIDTARGRAQAIAHLNEEGYAVLKDILSRGQCDETLEMIWEELESSEDVTPEHQGGVQRADPSTWLWRHNYPKGGEGGRYGHSRFLWHVRGLPKVKSVWELLCGTTELLVSFDGSCLYRPWGLRPEWNAVHTLGLHTDRVNRPGTADGYVQGFVNLITTSAASGGNVRATPAPAAAGAAAATGTTATTAATLVV